MENIKYDSKYKVQTEILGQIGGDKTIPYDSEYSVQLAILEQVKNGGGGGGTGTTNYNGLTNKPQINSVELRGNKTLDELGIAKKADVDKINDELAGVTAIVDKINDELAGVTAIANEINGEEI